MPPEQRRSTLLENAGQEYCSCKGISNNRTVQDVKLVLNILIIIFIIATIPGNFV